MRRFKDPEITRMAIATLTNQEGFDSARVPSYSERGADIIAMRGDKEIRVVVALWHATHYPQTRRTCAHGTIGAVLVIDDGCWKYAFDEDVAKFETPFGYTFSPAKFKTWKRVGKIHPEILAREMFK